MRFSNGLCAALIFSSACASRLEPGIRVEVELAPDARASCARVVVMGEGVLVLAESSPFSVSASQPSFVAVARGALPSEVTIQALGYSDAACTARVADEASPLVTVTFAESGLLDLVLRIAGPRSGTDGGTRDGGLISDAGQPDGGGCFSCAGASCNGQPCAGAASAALASCDEGVCRERACGNNLDDNGARGIDCFDSDCSGQTCGSGVCAGMFCTSEVNCSDGLDNDSNGKVDCADSSCEAKVCSDGLACSVNEVCSAGTCSAGTSRVCAAPGQCFTAGTCSEPDGCSTSVRDGASCNDGRACTSSDACGGDGGCTGAATVCASPPGQCFQSTGTCLEPSGVCSYAARAGSCDDGVNCTIADVCAADGGCTGTPVICTPNECQTSTGTCSGAGACLFLPKTGAACGAGRGQCSSQGTCVTLYPYVPSNFTLDQLAPNDGGLNLTVTCPVIIETGNSVGQRPRVTDGGACLSIAPTLSVIEQSTGGEALLVTVDNLVVSAGGVLHFDGERPVILAVLGGATIAGAIDVSATDQGPGAGGRDCGDGNGAAALGGDGRFSGGGGAGYGAPGASGGYGFGGPALDGGGVPGVAGLDNASATLAPLRGGCFGGNGNGTSDANKGHGAFASGAVQISAAGAMTISGQVSAAGGGGQGATRDSGGGGGGSSGGGVLLEANTVTLSGALTANGGAGGCGSGNNRSGNDGPPGSATTASPASVSECGTSAGGLGGSGGAGSTAATAGGAHRSTTGGGGGGGGGGVGRIRVNSLVACTFSDGAVRSPTPSSSQPTCR